MTNTSSALIEPAVTSEECNELFLWTEEVQVPIRRPISAQPALRRKLGEGGIAAGGGEGLSPHSILVLNLGVKAKAPELRIDVGDLATASMQAVP